MRKMKGIKLIDEWVSIQLTKRWKQAALAE